MILNNNSTKQIIYKKFSSLLRKRIGISSNCSDRLQDGLNNKQIYLALLHNSFFFKSLALSFHHREHRGAKRAFS